MTTKEKKFYNIDTWGKLYKTFYGSNLLFLRNKLECFVGKARYLPEKSTIESNVMKLFKTVISCSVKLRQAFPAYSKISN